MNAVKPLLTDPVVLICGAAIFVGVILFFWAVGKFRTKATPVVEPSLPSTDDALLSAPSGFSFDARESAPPAPAAVPARSSGTTPVNKDVADRLETMSQRLSEMQTVLMKQTGDGGTGDGGTAAGGTTTLGQGFSPETIEKLLKIVGNVIQQVDILQKSLNPPDVPKANTPAGS